MTNGVAAVAAGGHHACALMTTGSVRCWGRFAGYGRVPVEIRGLPSGIRALAGGSGGVACALTDAGVVCWSTPDGPSRNPTCPGAFRAVTLGSDPADGVRGLGGRGTHSCLLTSAGGIKCAGANHAGELGNGTTTNSGGPATSRG